jgi:hypothetical protein
VGGLEGIENIYFQAEQQTVVLDKTASCPSGKRLTGGGARVVAPADPRNGNVILESWPSSDTTWTASANFNSSSPVNTFHVYAICANVAP